MFNIADLCPELSFIADRRKYDPSFLSRTAVWLKSDFLAPIWKCVFAHRKKPIFVNFNVRLDDGTLLTDPRNMQLEHSLKGMLCAQDRVGMDLASRTMKGSFDVARQIIDWILLHSDKFKLAEHGLKLITKNDMIAFLTCLHGESTAKYNLYQPDFVGTKWIKTVISQITTDEVNRIKSKLPSISEIECERLIDLSDMELIHARCFLWKNGFYHKKYSNSEYPFKHQIRIEKVLDAAYSERIIGVPRFVNIALADELSFTPAEGRIKEFPAASKKTGIGDGIDEIEAGRYHKILSRMVQVSNDGFQSISCEALSVLNENAILDELRSKSCGRYATLPHEIVFSSFRSAVEFYSEYGDDLIDSYINLARKTACANTVINLLNNEDFYQCLTPKIKQMGVVSWSICTYNKQYCNDKQFHLTPNQFFTAMRSNKGLKELLDVLLGCIWIITATMTARRNTELTGLVPARCLVKIGSFFHIRFFLRKRNIGEIREEVVRPIPKIAAKCIKSLKRLHEELAKLGNDYGEDNTSLFACPSSKCTLSKHVNSSHYLFRFGDYFQLPLNDPGERYYPGTHQLRRFFAILFFWGQGFGGLDTLSWFLGHTNVEHVWNYITENTPGAILNRIKASYAGEKVRQGAASASELAAFLKKHYGIANFSIMNANDIADYIEHELVHHNVNIEPIFYDAVAGKRYEILIKVIFKP